MTEEQQRRARAIAYLCGWQDGAANLRHRGEMLTELVAADYAEGYRHGAAERKHAAAAIAATYDVQQERLGR